MSNVTRYKGESNRGPSPAIWGDQAKLRADANAGKCQYFFEDFAGWSGHTVNTNANIIGDTGAWRVLADAGVTVNPVANTIDLSVAEHGVLTIDGADADNDEAYISRVYDTHKFDLTYGYRLLFEARVKEEEVNTGIGIAVGFARKSDVAAGFLADNTTDLVATACFVGFHTLDAAGQTLRTSYQNASQTKQNISTSAGTLANATWVKLGLVYEPFAASGKALRFYINGTELADYGTYAQVSNTTLFPDDITVTPVVAFKIDGTANKDAYVDWISAAQYLDQ